MKRYIDKDTDQIGSKKMPPRQYVRIFRIWNLSLLAVALTALLGGVTVTNAATDDHGYLGVYLGEVDEELRATLRLKASGGALIDEVIDDGPAAKAGLEEGDVILVFKGKKIANEEILREQIKTTKVGDQVKVVVFRDGKEKTFTVEMGKGMESAAQSLMIKNMKPHKMMMKRFACECDQECGYLGVELQRLSAQLGEYFKVKDGDGALISSVEKDSPAEKAGLKAGDVILRLEEEKIRKPADLKEELCEFKPDQEITLEVIRAGLSKTTKVTLGKCPKEKCPPGECGMGPGVGRLGSEDCNFDFEGMSPKISKELRIELDRPMDDLQEQLDELRKELDELRQEVKK